MRFRMLSLHSWHPHVHDEGSEAGCADGLRDGDKVGVLDGDDVGVLDGDDVGVLDGLVDGEALVFPHLKGSH